MPVRSTYWQTEIAHTAHKDSTKQMEYATVAPMAKPTTGHSKNVRAMPLPTCTGMERFVYFVSTPNIGISETCNVRIALANRFITSQTGNVNTALLLTHTLMGCTVQSAPTISSITPRLIPAYLVH